jgi:DNA-binding FrmR family transcriptional regulator
MRAASNRAACKNPRMKQHPRPARLKSEAAQRLSRAEGQLRGIKRMIEGDAYCIDVLQQISAARRALDRVALMLLRDHMETCVADAIAARKPEEKIREVIDTVDRFLA